MKASQVPQVVIISSILGYLNLFSVHNFLFHYENFGNLLFLQYLYLYWFTVDNFILRGYFDEISAELIGLSKCRRLSLRQILRNYLHYGAFIYQHIYAIFWTVYF
jgi:hypothetical protein